MLNIFIDPIAFYIYDFPIRWYGISYSIGISLAWFYARLILRFFPSIKKSSLDDFVIWATLGIIFGGRLGHIFLYDLSTYINNPIEILQIWKGGMSFHGGLIGLSIVSIIFAKKHKIKLIDLANCLSCISPIGLFFGRIANFINQELYGKITDVAWAVHFNLIDTVTVVYRHPSQLYEAMLEGVLLFFIMLIIMIKNRTYCIVGYFLIFYSIFRCFCEYFKDNTGQEEYLYMTLGQIYCIPMLIIGIIMVLLTKKNHKQLKYI